MTEQPSSPPSSPRYGASRSSPGLAVLGLGLIAIGVLFFAGQYLEIDWGRASWPFYVIVPGVILAAIGLSQRGGVGMTIAGSIITIVGLILLYQNTTDHWESWAYAWALVGPGGSGIGMLLHGIRTGSGRMMREGFWQVVTAAGLFIAGYLFFEGVIGISGQKLPLPDWLLPAVIIVLGVALLIRAFVAGDQHDEEPTLG